LLQNKEETVKNSLAIEAAKRFLMAVIALLAGGALSLETLQALQKPLALAQATLNSAIAPLEDTANAISPPGYYIFREGNLLPIYYESKSDVPVCALRFEVGSINLSKLTGGLSFSFTEQVYAIPANALPSSVRDSLHAIPANAIPANDPAAAIPANAIPANAIPANDIEKYLKDEGLVDSDFSLPVWAIPANITVKIDEALMPALNKEGKALKYQKSLNNVCVTQASSGTSSSGSQSDEFVPQNGSVTDSGNVFEPQSGSVTYTGTWDTGSEVASGNTDPCNEKITDFKIYVGDPGSTIQMINITTTGWFLFADYTLDVGGGRTFSCEKYSQNRLTCSGTPFPSGTIIATVTLHPTSKTCKLLSGTISIPVSSNVGVTPGSGAEVAPVCTEPGEEWCPLWNSCMTIGWCK
jgi:hypothetical protein